MGAVVAAAAASAAAANAAVAANNAAQVTSQASGSMISNGDYGPGFMLVILLIVVLGVAAVKLLDYHLEWKINYEYNPKIAIANRNKFMLGSALFVIGIAITVIIAIIVGTV